MIDLSRKTLKKDIKLKLICIIILDVTHITTYSEGNLNI
jgi:hypothetical protein